MTTKVYKGYRINVVGIGHSIYRPDNLHAPMSAAFTQSMRSAQRWINTDIQERERQARFRNAMGLGIPVSY